MNEVSEMIKEYSRVKLNTGEIGYVIEIYEEGKAYEIELPKFELKTVKSEDIAEVLQE